MNPSLGIMSDLTTSVLICTIPLQGMHMIVGHQLHWSQRVNSNVSMLTGKGRNNVIILDPYSSLDLLHKFNINILKVTSTFFEAPSQQTMPFETCPPERHCRDAKPWQHLRLSLRTTMLSRKLLHLLCDLNLYKLRTTSTYKVIEFLLPTVKMRENQT